MQVQKFEMQAHGHKFVIMFETNNVVMFIKMFMKCWRMLLVIGFEIVKYDKQVTSYHHDEC